MKKDLTAISSDMKELFGSVARFMAIYAPFFVIVAVTKVLIADAHSVDSLASAGGSRSAMIEESLFSLVYVFPDCAIVHVAVALLGKKRLPGYRDAIVHGARAWFRVVLTGFIASLIMLLYALALLVPGILKWLSYAILIPLQVEEGRFGSDALAESTLRMNGKRKAAFVALLPVAFLPLAYEWGFGGIAPWLGRHEVTGASFRFVAELVDLYAVAILALPSLLITVSLYVRSLPSSSASKT